MVSYIIIILSLIITPQGHPRISLETLTDVVYNINHREKCALPGAGNLFERSLTQLVPL